MMPKGTIWFLIYLIKVKSWRNLALFWSLLRLLGVRQLRCVHLLGCCGCRGCCLAETQFLQLLEETVHIIGIHFVRGVGRTREWTVVYFFLVFWKSFFDDISDTSILLTELWSNLQEVKPPLFENLFFM